MDPSTTAAASARTLVTSKANADVTADASARTLARERHGVVAVYELRAIGLSNRQIAQLRGSPRWEQLSRDVLRVRGAPVTDASRAAAGVLDAGPSAVLSDLSAASRWGLSSCALFPLTAVTARSSRRRPTLARLSRVRCLPDRWVTELDSIPIVRPEFVAVRLFALHRPERAGVLVDRLWSMRLLSGPSIARFVDDMAASGRNGIAGLRVYLDERGPGYVPSATNLESRVRKILGDAGIQVDPQVDAGGDRWTGRVDFRVRGRRVLIEVQSQTYHAALVDRRRDAARLQALRRAGFVVVEIWDTTVWSDPAEVVRQVRAAIARS